MHTAIRSNQTAIEKPLFATWTCLQHGKSYTPSRIHAITAKLECLQPINATSTGCIWFNSSTSCRRWMHSLCQTPSRHGICLDIPTIATIQNEQITFPIDSILGWVLCGLFLLGMIFSHIYRRHKPVLHRVFLAKYATPDAINHTIVEPVTLTTLARQNSHVQLGDLTLWALEAAHLQAGRVLNVGAEYVVCAGVYYNKPVAIKMRKAGRTCRNAQAFVHQIQLHCRLNCPHVVQSLGCIYRNVGDLRLIVEYMDMGDLRQMLGAATNSITTYTWQQKLHAGRRIALALSFLHERNYIHRNIKSRNVLLHSRGDVKLAGLGALSRVTFPDSTLASSFRWMAPEIQWHAGAYTPAADIYSLGVVLWELDSHAIPYANEQVAFGWDDAKLRRQLTTDESLSLAFSPTCSMQFQRLAMQCLARRPEQRPTAIDIVIALESQIEC